MPDNNCCRSISVLITNAHSTGDRCCEVQSEVDVNKHIQECKPTLHVSAVCDKQVTTRHGNRRTGEKTYSCGQCEKWFLTAEQLRWHVHVHNGKYKCSECGKCCRDKGLLTRHRRVHSGEKPFECCFCGKQFAEAGNLKRHERIHSGEKPYKCHFCSKAFRSSDEVNSHLRVHAGDKPFKCLLCEKSFSTSSHLHTHERHIHSDVRPHSCYYCGKQFKQVGDVKRHVRVHTGAKPFSCGQCKEVFGRPDHLKTHLLKSHSKGTWVTCHICQKKFCTKGDLKKHVH